MRIQCPFCGDRQHSEFTYLGDAAFVRPDPGAVNAAELFTDAVYLRDNPAGVIQELWYHRLGCRQWLKLTRNTTTHAILGARMAREGAD